MKQLPTTVKNCYECPYHCGTSQADYRYFFCRISDANISHGFTKEGISKVCPLEDVEEGPDFSYGDMIGQGGH